MFNAAVDCRFSCSSHFGLVPPEKEDPDFFSDGLRNGRTGGQFSVKLVVVVVRRCRRRDNKFISMYFWFIVVVNVADSSNLSPVDKTRLLDINDVDLPPSMMMIFLFIYLLGNGPAKLSSDRSSVVV